MSSGGEWAARDKISRTRMNQKTLYVGSSAPADPQVGQLWYDTDENLYKQYNGSAWNYVTVNRLVNPTISYTAGATTVIQETNPTTVKTGHIKVLPDGIYLYNGLNWVKKALTITDWDIEETLLHSHDAEVSHLFSGSSDPYFINKTITLTLSSSAKIKVKWDWKLSTGVLSNSQIWINGVAVGTNKTGSHTTWVTETDEVTVNSGDAVQLRTQCNSAITIYVRNFRIYGIKTATTTLPVTLSGVNS